MKKKPTGKWKFHKIEQRHDVATSAYLLDILFIPRAEVMAIKCFSVSLTRGKRPKDIANEIELLAKHIARLP